MAAELTEKTKLLITIGVGIVVNLGVWGFYYKLTTDLEVLNKTLAGIKSENAKLKVEADRLPGLITEIAKYNDMNKERLAELPTESKRADFRQKVSDLANLYHLELIADSGSFNKPTDVQGLSGDEYKRDSFEYSYSADFNGTWNFLNMLEEKWDRFISIEDFDVKARDSGMNLTGAKHDIHFKINTYYYTPRKGEQ